MVVKQYIKDFENLGFGLFVHFGLYSNYGKGEWSEFMHKIPKEKYEEKLFKRFKPAKNWAKNLVETAKKAGCKYITLTTRHHEGFSLFDTKGLTEFDSVHSCGRDIVKEFVDECNKNGIVPFFYHTLLDWHNPDYYNNFPLYIDYLVKSIEILCSNYGKIGGLWFDGMWDKKDADWQEDRIYSTIRKYQPTAMIINNTGLSELGKVGHEEIDSVTFERGNPSFVDNSDKYRAGEMCQVLNDHWGYCKNDCNYKSVKELIENLIDCRRFNCNFLLNCGPMGNGMLKCIDKGILLEIGKWIKLNKNFIYSVKSCDVTAENAYILKGEDKYYAIVKNVTMAADENVQLSTKNVAPVIPSKKIKSAHWLDSGKRIKVKNNSFMPEPFKYGSSLSVRVAVIEFE
ncbi:MAG: alpha-L-fucosidase [Clostridia bacterium]|nr:alpha-L-fucosidase [Clostridia bacterium]